ncbi:hypothetical protein BGX26_007521, partial [Mortierella sp. AD094]
FGTMWNGMVDRIPLKPPSSFPRCVIQKLPSAGYFGSNQGLQSSAATYYIPEQSFMTYQWVTTHYNHTITSTCKSTLRF